ncbi:MAG: hypothetical protein PHU21_06090, partial [Elusimicrobia bacterium]|nr:hypothetical protein [Elusimicrobiota bacterium]
MNELYLDIHGVGVTLRGGPEDVLEDLRRDFEYFSMPFPAEAGAIELDLEPRSPEAAPEGKPVFRTKDYAVLAGPAGRIIVYADGARAEYDYAARRGRILCADPERLHELALLAVLSRAGEALDLRGWHRIHAL